MLRFTNIDHKPTRTSPVYGYLTHPLLPLRQALDPILPRINQLEEFIKIAKTQCYFPSEHGLTREESAAIYLYTMEWGEQSLYLVLNKELRNSDRSVLLPWHGYLKLFDTALKKLPSLQSNLWRGINVNISKNFNTDATVVWWYFNSCSSVLKVIEQFINGKGDSTLFMIEAKNGKSISSYSSLPNENEVILGLGTRFRVLGDPFDHPNLNIVHLVELSDDDEEELSSSMKSMAVSQTINTAFSK
jgi:hypothetical protein